MYALIYGGEWEDMKFFTTFEKGFLELENELKHKSDEHNNFNTMLVKYESQADDRFEPTDVWKRNPRDKNTILHKTSEQEWGC